MYCRGTQSLLLMVVGAVDGRSVVGVGVVCTDGGVVARSSFLMQ